MKCPICGHWVEDDDYWCNGMCLRCALEREQIAGRLEQAGRAIV